MSEKRDLLTWIKDCENKIDERNIESDENKREFFQKIYDDSEHMRKYFFDNYLNNISNNLNSKSNKDSYKYKDFFRRDQPEIKNKYYSLFEKGKEKEKKKNDK